jgi:hypothetical protein
MCCFEGKHNSELPLCSDLAPNGHLACRETCLVIPKRMEVCNGLQAGRCEE